MAWNEHGIITGRDKIIILYNDVTSFFVNDRRRRRRLRWPGWWSFTVPSPRIPSSSAHTYIIKCNNNIRTPWFFFIFLSFRRDFYDPSVLHKCCRFLKTYFHREHNNIIYTIIKAYIYVYVVITVIFRKTSYVYIVYRYSGENWHIIILYLPLWQVYTYVHYNINHVFPWLSCVIIVLRWYYY